MISSTSFFASIAHGRRLRQLALLTSICALGGVAFAQSEPAAQPAASDAAANDRRSRRGQNGDRPNFNPEEMQQRMANMLREQMGVTDDAEWKIIQDRMQAVNELRRSAAGGMFGGFRGAGGPGGQGGGRGTRGSNPEADALRQAVSDKLPDAEVKARLTRLREVRKANEDKLTKAQEDLRSVLTVRQEAVCVMFGLLP